MGERLKRPSSGNAGTRHKSRTLNEPMVEKLVRNGRGLKYENKMP
jgi:hypothetical protein